MSNVSFLRIAAATAWMFLAVAPSRAEDAPDFEFRVLPHDGTASAPAPKFLFLFGSPARWPGSIAWSYNPAGAPFAFANVSAAVSALDASATKWSALCGVQFSYQGTTSTTPNTHVNGGPDFANVVGWGRLGAGILGVTNAYYSPNGNPPYALVDSDIALSLDLVTSSAAMDRAATHEWGHALGLAHSNLNDQVMSGTPDSQYNSRTVLQDDDVRGCRCLYGMPAGQHQGYICSLPRRVDFGSVDVLASSAPQTISLRNDGNAPLIILSYFVAGSDFLQPTGCTSGTTLSPGAACLLTLEARPITTGSRIGDLFISTSDGLYDLPLLAVGNPGAPPQQPIVDVIEYYFPARDHYFMSSLAADVQALDGGQFPGWQRTGLTFKAYAAPTAGAVAVCRFYLPPPFGDSHFYSASAQECGQVLQRFPAFVYESAAVMYVGLPDATTGACAPGFVPVYRVWDNRLDTNHRYTTDRALRDQLVQAGWVKEGYGADFVIMCAPG